MLNLVIMSKLDYDNTIRDINNLYEGRGQDFQCNEAIRNASLSAMMFMLLAKDKGWDTCPMIAFDPDEVKQIFKIPENYEIVLMISMGKENTIKQRMTGYRRPVGEFVKFNSFE